MNSNHNQALGQHICSRPFSFANLRQSLCAAKFVGAELKLYSFYNPQRKKNPWPLVLKLTIPADRPTDDRSRSVKLISTFAGSRRMSLLPSVLYNGAAAFYWSSSSIIILRLSGFRSRPTNTQKIWQSRNRTRDLCIRSQELWALDVFVCPRGYVYPSLKTTAIRQLIVCLYLKNSDVYGWYDWYRTQRPGWRVYVFSVSYEENHYLLRHPYFRQRQSKNIYKKTKVGSI
jgi:hypothetical protein